MKPCVFAGAEIPVKMAWNQHKNVQGWVRNRVCIALADIPLKKAVAGVRVGLLPEVGFVVNPTVQQMEESKLDLIMAGTDSAVLMIEGYCDFLTEDQMLEV